MHAKHESYHLVTQQTRSLKNKHTKERSNPTPATAERNLIALSKQNAFRLMSSIKPQ